MAEVTPVTLLIGFPGAGKTTLLQRLASQPGMADTAMVAAQPEPAMWWNAGCPCCAPRDDVARALRALLPRVRRDEVRRVVIETTGLADPGPILATLLSDTVAASAYRLDGVVAVVDAVNGVAILESQEKAVRQVATAERIVLTKTGLADPAPLRARLRRLNPDAICVDAQDAASEAPLLPDTAPAGVPAWVDAWLNGPASAATDRAAPAGDSEVQAFDFTGGGVLSLQPMLAALERLVLLHGDAVLRMKAVLLPEGQECPVAVHSVRHLLFPPLTLTCRPAPGPHSSRLAFITRALPRATVEAVLAESHLRFDAAGD